MTGSAQQTGGHRADFDLKALFCSKAGGCVIRLHTLPSIMAALSGYGWERKVEREKLVSRLITQLLEVEVRSVTCD